MEGTAGFEIRAPIEDELDAICRGLPERAAELHAERVERQQRGDFAYLIAWVDGEAVGHVGVWWSGMQEPEEFVERFGCAQVHDLQVRASHRGLGLGRSLMLALEERAVERGEHTIGLGSGLDDGYAAARSLYRSLAYIEVPGSLFIESSPGSGGIYLEILTYWLKELDRP
jgi:GNAT superfamily N-acetyltransferase